MGCSGSKLDDLEAVSLCRKRSDLLAAAIRHRYALAASHSAYSSSLRSLASSLHRFLEYSSHLQPPPPQSSSSSPLLSLPPDSKKAKPKNIPSPDDSGSHIQFHSSDSDSEVQDSISDRHHHHLDLEEEEEEEEVVQMGPTYTNYHYARPQPPPNSVSFEIPHQSQSSLSYPTITNNDYNYYSNYSDSTANNNYSSYPYDYAPNNYYGFFAGSSSSPPPPPNLPPPAVGPTAAAPKPPPPPPSPPRASTWDFLNPFAGHESYYDNGNDNSNGNSYPPSRSSREVRDEEGIPDLEEEEEEEHEVVKEVYGEGSSSGEHKVGSKAEGIGRVEVGAEFKARAEEEEEGVVEKKVVGGDEVQRRPQRNVNVGGGSSSNVRKYHNVSEIGSEIRVQFERASDAVAELEKILEVGKHPYHYKKSSVIEVSSVMMCMMLPSTSNGEEFLILDEDIAASSGNLSSTLQKLYIWERKLQDEVRAEEKLRLFHDRNCRRLKHLIDRGAEGHKIEEVQKLIKKLNTKIRIAIQIVDSISSKINKLRDEELWPQIDLLIQGLVKMWKVMLECHQIQCHAISEAKNIDSISSGAKLNDTLLDAIMELQLELLRWTGNFSSWITAQKEYVKALNGWLVLGLHYEPVVTEDGIAPYSPGRIGAPPVFVICNYWSQAMDIISEKEVISSMQSFSINLRRIWEQQTGDPQQKMMPNGDMDRLVKARERESQIIQKEMDALHKKLVVVSGQNDIQSYSSEVSSLHLGLKQIFEAMESFTATSLKAYEDLHVRSEEEKIAGANSKVS